MVDITPQFTPEDIPEEEKPFPQDIEEEEIKVNPFTFREHTHQDTTSRKIIGYSVVPITISVYGADAATAANYGTFFIADRTYRVKEIREIHRTAGSDGSAVTLQVERLQGTEAKDAGDDLLSTAFNLKGTADTVQTGTVSTASNIHIIQKGNRLGLVTSGTLTAVADVCVTVLLEILDIQK